MDYQIKQYNTPNLPRDYYIADKDGRKITDITEWKQCAERMLLVQQQMNDGKFRTKQECEDIFADMAEML